MPVKTPNKVVSIMSRNSRELSYLRSRKKKNAFDKKIIQLFEKKKKIVDAVEKQLENGKRPVLKWNKSTRSLFTAEEFKALTDFAKHAPIPKRPVISFRNSMRSTRTITNVLTQFITYAKKNSIKVVSARDENRILLAQITGKLKKNWTSDAQLTALKKFLRVRGFTEVQVSKFFEKAKKLL